VAKEKQPIIPNKSKIRCGSCRKIGHEKEDCWELEANKDKQTKNWNQI
jgi:hypothetical protein